MFRMFLLGLFIALLSVNTAQAAPVLVSVGSGGLESWTDAINAGDIVAVDTLTFSGNQFYAAQPAPGFQAVLPQLTPDISVNDGFNAFDSLVMSWDMDNINQNDLIIAAWDYQLGAGIDLTPWHIKFSLLPPTGVWDVSLELIDGTGRSRGWFLPDPASLGLADIWTDFVIWPNLMMGQGAFSVFIDQPGFDITDVVAIRLNESGMFSQPFPANPAGTPITDAWNAWNHLFLVSEPASMMLMVLGLIGFWLNKSVGKLNC